MIKAHIVLGTFFGDEGKGSVVNYLAKKILSEGGKPVVVRFSGGPQAGHTVHLETGISHVFSSVGAAALQGVSTFWSNHCLFEPGAFVKENSVLAGKYPSKIQTQVETDCNVITPYDRIYGQRNHLNNGTCGLGIGAAMERINTSPYKIFLGDLLGPDWILEYKLQNIRKYYVDKYPSMLLCDDGVAEFLTYSRNLRNMGNVRIPYKRESFGETLKQSSITDIIFEGSQGILLDKDFGMFPHVTYANTTAKNALDILYSNYAKNEVDLTTYFVSRFYLTRHGNGPFPSEPAPPLINTENETNVYNQWQGDFRISPFDIDLYKYSLVNSIPCDSKVQYMFTCLDQLPDGYVRYVNKGNVNEIDVSRFFLDLTNEMKAHKGDTHQSLRNRIFISESKFGNFYKFN